MYLQTQPDVQPVLQYPLRQQARIKLAVGAIALRARVFEKSRGKQDARGLAFELMLAGEVAGKFIILAAGEHELDLVARRERVEVGKAKRSAFTRTRTLDVHNLMHGPGDVLQRAFAAGF